MSLEVNYKGQQIAQLTEDGSLTLNTAGKYCEGDIGLAYFNEGTNVELANIAVRTHPTKMLYKVGEAFDPTGMEVVANYTMGEDALNNVLITNYTYSTGALVTGNNTITISYTFDNVTKTTNLIVKAFTVTTLENTSWADISAISAAGAGDLLWDIGDTKSVKLSGTMGDTALDTTVYMYIIGFDHNAELEGYGITFSGFKSAATNGKDICLISSVYASSKTDGTKCYNMNHWGNYNYGGWKASDMRYDILGSTNVAPSNYGAARTTSSIGYDATSTCATNPVANTLMSCLPSDLRAVMKPITKYTNNIGNANQTQAAISSSIDYLPLLAAGEIFGGSGSHANCFEQLYLEQYAYYAAGNPTVKYRHSSQSSTAVWWTRSPIYNSSYSFCLVYTSGNVTGNIANTSYGVVAAVLI